MSQTIYGKMCVVICKSCTIWFGRWNLNTQRRHYRQRSWNQAFLGIEGLLGENKVKVNEGRVIICRCTEPGTPGGCNAAGGRYGPTIPCSGLEFTPYLFSLLCWRVTHGHSFLAWSCPLQRAAVEILYFQLQGTSASMHRPQWILALPSRCITWKSTCLRYQGPQF